MSTWRQRQALAAHASQLQPDGDRPPVVPNSCRLPVATLRADLSVNGGNMSLDAQYFADLRRQR
jgi:hypothetical protein